jgi:transforming growth factor-beta-induced protein
MLDRWAPSSSLALGRADHPLESPKDEPMTFSHKRVTSLFATTLLAATMGLAPTLQARATDTSDQETAADQGRPTIVGLAQSSPDLSILVAAVQRAGLVDTLQSGRYTVFAPTNQAFLNLLPKLGASRLEDIPVDALRGVLLDHVLLGRNKAERLSGFDQRDVRPFALGGLPIDFDRSPAAVNNASIVAADLAARNGVVHVIDTVLLDPDPRPTLVQIAVGNPDFSILVTALQKAGLVDVVNSLPAATVFAPNNAAFVRLLAQLNLKSLEDVPVWQLRQILLDHVVYGEQDAVDVLERGRLRAIGGLRLEFSASPLQVNGINIIATDVEGRNGTIHVIDGVLLRTQGRH